MAQRLGPPVERHKDDDIADSGDSYLASPLKGYIMYHTHLVPMLTAIL